MRCKSKQVLECLNDLREGKDNFFCLPDIICELYGLGIYAVTEDEQD